MSSPDGTKRRARVVIADDHLLTRAGLRAVLETDPRFEVVGEATNGEEVLALTRRIQPDLVLMDIRMPNMNGVEATAAIRQANPSTVVLILSMFEDSQLLLAAMRAGAAGYILKGSSEASLRTAMSDALAGNFPLTRQLAQDLVQRMAGSAEPTQLPGTDRLSSREQQVLALLARGYTNRAIAEALVVTASTVKVHVQHILAKLGVADRTQAAVAAMDLGYLRPDRPHQQRQPVWQRRAGNRGAC